MNKILLTLAFYPFLMNGQNYDCESIYNWTKKTFEENDAGYQYVLDAKGEQAYALHNKIFIDKVKKANSKMDCHQIVYEWLHFFRDKHIDFDYVGELLENPVDNISEKNNDAFKDWETFSIPVKNFEQYLNQKINHDYEGIWEGEGYKIGIKKLEFCNFSLW